MCTCMTVLVVSLYECNIYGCLQKEREVKRQRKLLEQQLERMNSPSETGSEGQSSTALLAIDDCESLCTCTASLAL